MYKLLFMAKGIKTGGRKKGTPNKLTSELRKVLKEVLTDELETLPTLMAYLEPKDRLQAIIKLMPYILPKVDSVSIDEGEPMQWSL